MLARTSLATRYLDLVKKSLVNELYVEIEARYRLAIGAAIAGQVATFEGLYDLRPHATLIEGYLHAKSTGGTFLPAYETGEPAYFMRNFLEQSHTMIGRKRLDNIQSCIETVLHDNIPGDLIETGIWRGGAIILMRAVLAAYDITDRIVWAADSFAGVPPPTHPQDQEFDVSETIYPFLTVSVNEVKSLIDRYDLLDDRIRFLEGWFKNTLPVAPIRRLAVLRLDGDLFESTMDALIPLYAKVSPGGFIIVDDYYSCQPCRNAIDWFRTANGIKDPFTRIDDQSLFWRKSA